MTSESIPVEVGDALIHGWEASGLGDFIGRIEMEFDASLDAGTLRRAVELLLEAEPILCSRLVPGEAPYWQTGGETNREAFCSTTLESEYEAIRDRPLEIGLQIEVCLQRRAEGDRLLLKVAHQVSDGGSDIELAQRLASIYSGLADDEGFKPAVMPEGDRSLGAVFSKLPKRALFTVGWEFIQVVYRLWRTPTFGLSGEVPPEDEPWSRVLRRLEPDRVKAIAAYGRARQATLNDVFIAAYFRSLVAVGKWDGSSNLYMPMTVDLRRWYLQGSDSQGVSNFSATELLFLGKHLGNNFDETLARVVGLTRRLKSRYPGILTTSLLRRSKAVQLVAVKPETRLDPKPFVRPGIPPVFTNMGLIDKKTLDFGGSQPHYAYLLPSSLTWPALVVGLSGYDGMLTLSARSAASAEPAISAILDGILAELPTTGPANEPDARSN